MTIADAPQSGPGTPVIAPERLIAMANQIGDFFAPYPPARRAEGVRNHLRTYWDPRMREALLHLISTGDCELHPHVVEGARLLGQEASSKPGYYGPPKA